MANEQWTPEQESDFQRAKSDYDALNAQRTRVMQANRNRLVDLCAQTFGPNGAGDVADDLAREANAFRVALAPYDDGPKPEPQPA